MIKLGASLALLALVGAGHAATVTTKYVVSNSAWTDLGAGPILLSFTGPGVYAIGDATPTIPLGEGFTMLSDESFPVSTSSHVWAMAKNGLTANAYAAPLASGGSPPVTSTWSAADAAAVSPPLSLTNGNMTVAYATTGSGWLSIRSTISRSAGKLYMEFFTSTGTASYYSALGVANSGFNLNGPINTPYSAGLQCQGAMVASSGFTINDTLSSLPPAQPNDVFGIAIDFTAGNIWFSRNNTWLTSGAVSNPATGAHPILSFVPATVGALFAALSLFELNGGTWTLQPTAAAQKYAPPTGFSPWN